MALADESPRNETILYNGGEIVLAVAISIAILSLIAGVLLVTSVKKHWRALVMPAMIELVSNKLFYGLIFL